jgi:hypothetical protein
MTGEDSTLDVPDNVQYIPPKELPMIKDPKIAEKKPGSDWLGIVYMIIALFVLIATFQLYFTLQELIRTWISDQFVPVVSAVYYSAVIIVGIWLIRDYLRKQ